METSGLKKFAAQARTDLMAQVGARLDYVLTADTAELRARAADIQEIKTEIAKTSKQALHERVAYLWFNRMIALRFMDANQYTDIGIVTPAPDQTQPEILSEAKTGSIDTVFAKAAEKSDILALLSGQTSVNAPEAAAYRKLFLGACHYYGTIMPFMFEKIDDWTELLLPDDLLSEHSVLNTMRAVMTKDACKDVEIIGWLYQFYIAEKKDDVFAALKKNTKITPENIPAATQLFTPHWIVRYLVENSLGRLWMLNNPQSDLTAQMDYYIAPVEAEEDFLRIASPEEIKICDPACGSGHMLTYAFDLLYAIYQERGYDSGEIPNLILTHNLFGIEIDERAGALAAFALTMKARARQRRFAQDGVEPNVCILENVELKDGELSEYITEVGRDLFTDDLKETLEQFTEAKNFGSLIVPKLKDVSEATRIIASKRFEGKLFLRDVHQRVQTVLRMADYLSSKYHVVVANPPYMGGKGMNAQLKTWAGKMYPDSKSDLFAMFMERSLSLLPNAGIMGMLNLPSWMFLSSFEKLRAEILSEYHIASMVHCGRGLFGSDFGTVAFCIRKQHVRDDEAGVFRRLFDKHVDVRKPQVIEKLFLDSEYGRYIAAKRDFEKVPGQPIAYWLTDTFRDAFEGENFLSKATPIQGIITGKTEHFLRLWPEVNHDNLRNADEPQHHQYWVPYTKGGEGRKWYGNNEHLLNWKNGGQDLVRSRSTNSQFYFQPCITWTLITSADFAARYCPKGFLWDVAGSIAFPNPPQRIEPLLGFLCSSVCRVMLKSTNPTMNTNIENIENLPVRDPELSKSVSIFNVAVGISKSDWDAYETSWDFTNLPLLRPDTRTPTLAESFTNLRQHWRQMTDEMQSLEQENNRIFIDAYGLQDELTSDVTLNEITLTCNPAYRYRGKNTPEELEDKLRADTMREFLHYAVGCMFGRYSLDVPGLILANQGETLADYLARVPEPTFEIDDDNIIPILDANWFSDDIVERFKIFLRTTFGTDHYAENLACIEDAIGKDIRKWFLKDFYAYHWRRYKKRPIYWMISSPKGSFNVLFYMHRYRPELISQVLEDYLRPFQKKLEGHLEDLARSANDTETSARDIKIAIKEGDKIRATLRELEDWERDVLYPMAGRRLELDLDDGVKVNYPRFAPVLKKIPGL